MVMIVVSVVLSTINTALRGQRRAPEIPLTKSVRIN